MRQAILTLAFILTTFLCFGQKPHLEPANHFYQSEGVLKEYYKNVFSLLYKGYSEKPIARYTSMPSFSNPYSFSLEAIHGKNYVVSNRLSENYQYAKNKKKVKLFSKKTALANDFYLKIVYLFKLLEEQTKEPEIEVVGADGLIHRESQVDGTAYYFATTDKNGQIRIGEIRSRDNFYLLGRLVKICDNIYSIGNRKNISQTETLKDIDKLLNELKQ